MGSNYGLDRDFGSSRVKVRMGSVREPGVVTGGFMGWETGGKESWSVKDGPKVPGLMRRLESRRAPNRVLARDILHFFIVIINNTGGVVSSSVMWRARGVPGGIIEVYRL